jgi:hypothetical protein
MPWMRRFRHEAMVSLIGVAGIQLSGGCPASA